MKLRKSRRGESATNERQTHTFGHLAAKKTPSMVFALWGTSRRQQGERGCRASVWLTRGDIRVARPHFKRPRACLCQDGSALTDMHHARCVDSFRAWSILDDRHVCQMSLEAYLDRRISVNCRTYRPCSRTLTSGKRKYTPGRP